MHVILQEMTVTVICRRLRLIFLATTLTLLTYLSWGELNTQTKDSIYDENKRIERDLDKAIDEFASKFVSDKDMPEDSTKVLEIQSFLSCLVRKASWRATTSGLELVMPTTCSTQRTPSVFPVQDICQLLPGKRLLLVGPETTHFLHSLWLDIVEGRRNRTHTCPGREFCTFHHICQTPSISPEDSDTYDSRAGRKKKIPSDNFLRATRSAVLQYTFSTTLYAASNQSDALYQFPMVDPETGVQQISQYWLRRARKADVIIMSRAPMPAPISTYTLGSSGNWTFAATLCGQQNHFPANYCGISLHYDVAIAALDTTLRNFLPSIMQTLRKLETNNLFQDSLRVWHGHWFIQPSCALTGLPRDTPLLPYFWSCTDPVKPCHMMDPWTYFYNVQGTSHLSGLVVLLIAQFICKIVFYLASFLIMELFTCH